VGKRQVYYDGVITDITERIRRKERLRMLSKAVEQAKESVAITGAAPLEEPGPQFEYVNSVHEEMTGYAEEEILGKTPRIFQGPETEQDVLDSMRAALEAEEEWEGETINYRKDGEPYRIRWNVAPVRNEDGSIEHWVSTQRDVTEKREREETLRRQKRLLEQTQRLAGAWEVDLEAGEQSWSDKVYQIHEVEPGAEVSVEEGIEFYPPEARPRIREAFRNCIEEGEPYDLELPIVTAKGTRRWVRTVGAPAETKDGEVIKVAGAFQDITDRRTAQKDLEESEARFRGVFENAAMGIAIGSDKGRVIRSNPALQDMLGYSKEELRDCHFAELTHPDDLEKDKALFEEVAAGERDRYQIEKRYVRKDGEVFWGRLTVSRHGEERVIGMLEDIDEQKAAKADLRRSQERYRSLFEDSHDAILVHDLEGRIREVNPQAESLFGRGAGELEGRSIQDLHAPEEDETVQEKLRALRAGETYQAVARYERAGGSAFWGEVFASATDVGGETVVRSLIRDVTERKRRRRERENRLEALSTTIPGAAFEFRVGPGGERSVDFMGAEVKSLLSLPGESEALWKKLVEQIPKSHRDGILQSVEEAIDAQSRWQREIPFERPDGDRVWLLGSSKPTVEGDEIVFRGTLLDITDRKDGEQALRERQDKIEALYETANRLLRASSEEEVADMLVQLVRETLGYRGVSVRLAAGGTLTMSPEAESSSELRPFPPGFSIEGTSLVTEAYRTGETLTVEDPETAGVDDPITEGDVRSAVVVPMEGQGVLSVASPAPDAIGAFDRRMVEVLGAYGTAVLDRLDQEEALREERDLLDRLLATSPAAIVMTDEEGQFAYANEQAEAVLGIGKDEVPERAFNDPEWSITAVDGSPLPDRELPFARVLSTGEPVRDVRHAIEWPDGTRRILSVSGAPLRDADGHIEGALFHVADVTEQKRRMEALREAKEEAEEARRMQSAFLANMSHELRTPLTSIIGFAEAIGTEVADLELPAGSPVGTHAGLIEQSGKRLLDTLNSVLTLSKLEAEQMGFNAEPVDLHAEARWTAEELDAEAQEKDLDLHLETDDVRAQADEGGVQIVLRNLLANAIKYTEEGGTVCVRTYREEDRGVLEVEDTGIGMDPETVERLFEPFRQASEGFGREYEGTGVGLAVTKKAVEQMGGRIEVDTEEGEGSRFTVRLPRSEHPGEA
jgi:PAS domain S-box-containing protein